MAEQQAAAETKHITLGFVISWVLAVLFIVGGGIDIFQGTAPFGLVGILIGLVLLPPLSKMVEEKFKIRFSGGLKVGGVVVLLIIVRCRGSYSSIYL